jgi:hypothetical protein
VLLNVTGSDTKTVSVPDGKFAFTIDRQSVQSWSLYSLASGAQSRQYRPMEPGMEGTEVQLGSVRLCSQSERNLSELAYVGDGSVLDMSFFSASRRACVLERGAVTIIDAITGNWERRPIQGLPTGIRYASILAAPAHETTLVVALTTDDGQSPRQYYSIDLLERRSRLLATGSAFSIATFNQEEAELLVWDMDAIGLRAIRASDGIVLRQSTLGFSVDNATTDPFLSYLSTLAPGEMFALVQRASDGHSRTSVGYKIMTQSFTIRDSIDFIDRYDHPPSGYPSGSGSRFLSVDNSKTLIAARDIWTQQSLWSMRVPGVYGNSDPRPRTTPSEQHFWINDASSVFVTSIAASPVWDTFRAPGNIAIQRSLLSSDGTVLLCLGHRQGASVFLTATR